MTSRDFGGNADSTGRWREIKIAFSKSVRIGEPHRWS
jgi:hypothetical protein